jgi:hypothetical protein
MPRVKIIKKENAPKNLCDFPNFHKSGSIIGMKKLYYGQDALLVKCGDYIYNVTSEPEIYYNAETIKITYCIITTSEMPHIDILNENYPKVKNGVFGEITNNTGVKKTFLFENNKWNLIDTKLT